MFGRVSNVDDARELFEHAVNMCRRIPVVHLALAQFELNQGTAGLVHSQLVFYLIKLNVYQQSYLGVFVVHKK